MALYYLIRHFHHQFHHLERISVQCDGAQLADHVPGDGTVAGKRRQLGDLILQKELVVPAAVQQFRLGAGGERSAGLPRPAAREGLQFRAAGFIDLYAVADLLAGGDEFLFPFAGAQLAVFFFDHAGHHKNRVFGIGQRVAQFLQIFVRVGRRPDQRQLHQALAAKKRDGPRRQHDLLHRRRRAVQHRRLGVLLVKEMQRLAGSRAHQRFIRRIKIVQRAAALQPLFQLFFTVKHRVPPPPGSLSGRAGS